MHLKDVTKPAQQGNASFETQVSVLPNVIFHYRALHLNDLFLKYLWFIYYSDSESNTISAEFILQ